MAIELKFSKSDSGAPWGFRLVGGSDFEQPIVVVKVNENSLAKAAGLQEGDVIVRINDTSTASLTHRKAHDLLLSAGLELNLGIRRGQFAATTRVVNDEDYDTEFSDILKEVVESEIINESINKVEDIKNSLNSEQESIVLCITENLAGQEEILTTNESNNSESEKEKKWSTFLVKPDKPIPKLKRKVENQTIQGEPYRVVIKKQPRRAFQRKKGQLEQNVTKVEVEVEAANTEEITHIEMTGHGDIDNLEVEVKLTENEEIAVEESELNGYVEQNGEYDREIEDESEEQSHLKIKRDLIETKQLPLADIKIDTTIESSSSVQEQLLTVQKQLQALSQLPSAIQATLDSISKQLSIIVESKEGSEIIENGEDSSSNKDEIEPITEEEILEDTEDSEKAEAEVNSQDFEGESSSIEEEMEEDVNREENVGEQRQEEIEEEEGEPDPYAGLTEEEKEAVIRNEQLAAKRRKAMEERTPRPIQRPIILPGGRKWSSPEDAVPIFRKPKMSEEKIIETIESNLEVIVDHWNSIWPWSDKVKPVYRYCSDVWKYRNENIITWQREVKESNCWMVPSKVIATKHINFLKYQPPPKNLDYLQRSEVYRMVHDMEPPVRGIVSRPEKIPSVQDYYEATNGAL